MDKDKQPLKQSDLTTPDSFSEDERQADFSGAHASEPELAQGSELDDFYKRLNPEMRRPKPSEDAMAAALEVVQRLAAEANAEDAAGNLAQELTGDASGRLCRVCGYRNREGNKFCGMCGLPVESHDEPEVAGVSSRKENLPSEPPAALPRRLYTDREPVPRYESHRASSVAETHHYHHHYHHHYFPAGYQDAAPRSAVDGAREVDKLRPSAALRGESMSRAEVAVRRITQDWVLACNTKHLSDLLDLYVADALVLRSNYPPVRGAAAIREFFFSALDAGLGEVEVDPLRLEVVGGIAYEAGRCKALIPGASGKRREERGKYLWVLARQSNGEWKLAADCWSSDLTLAVSEPDTAPPAGAKPNSPRKGG